ncbi:MAG: type II secretion system F family protein [Candidatus Wallbacteria bacterium]|nr:type II secretion system F family protein [Candidatus Wallbacteria bacterium]
MMPGQCVAYVLANLALLAGLAHASGRLSGSALAIALLNGYAIVVRRASRGSESCVEEELQSVLSAIALALKRGRPLTHALRAGAFAAGPQLSDTLTRLVRNVELGMPLEGAMAQLQSGGLEPGLWVSLWAVVFACEAGAPGPELLDRLAGSLAHQLDLKRQFHILSINGRITALVLSALPIGLLALLLPFQPGMLRGLTSTPWGVPVLVALGLCWAAGLSIVAQLSGIWRSDTESREERVESELAVFSDLLAEGLDLGMEPLGLMSRLRQSMRPGSLAEKLDGVLREAALGEPLAAVLDRAGEGRLRCFALFCRFLADCGSGPGAGDVLRFHAREQRLRRHYRKSLELQKLPFHMLLALICLVFPLTFGLLLLPFVVRTASALR